MIFKDNKLFVLVDTFDDFRSLKLSVDETDTIYITYDNQEQTFGTPDVLWSQLVFVKSNKLIYSKGVIWTDNEFPAYDITTQDIERWNSLVSHVRADWNISDPSSYAYILNKNIVSDELSYLHTAYDQFTINYEKTNYVIASALTDLDTRVNNIDSYQEDISGKEDKMAIVAPVNQTDATQPITSLSCVMGRYYRIEVAVNTFTITLPAITDNTTVRTCVIALTTDTTPNVTFTAAAPSGGTAPAIYIADGFAIEASSTYEVNALWNGTNWYVAGIKLINQASV